MFNKRNTIKKKKIFKQNKKLKSVMPKESQMEFKLTSLFHFSSIKIKISSNFTIVCCINKIVWYTIIDTRS